MCKLAELEWTQCIYGCWEHPKGDAYLQWPRGITVEQFQKFIWLFLRLSISCIIDDRFAFFSTATISVPSCRIYYTLRVTIRSFQFRFSLRSLGLLLREPGDSQGFFFFFSSRKRQQDSAYYLKIIKQSSKDPRDLIEDCLPSTNLHDSKRSTNFRSKKFTR